ncbi:MAG: UDP-N-acetylglucosamine 2-epimerase (non-hydrolyzing) [Hydrogenophaga sp.]|jgi:UDP-N-acetylglucosamine 2-epimerase (non-hydrolysing)/UDP-N-acetylglucosamine 2-epimerase (hydrolysing)|nr:UDP-N-acetylglucosamine 2-epimerase (non-hydrolyzing) [Hydrogenophaga sp.]
MTTYLACIGTRPEIIKMASLHRVLKARGDRMLVLHTGQHEAMAHVLYRFFDMGPDLQIQLQRTSPRLGNLTAELLDSVDRVIGETKPDVVLVQGDTSSALVGAMAGYYHNRPVAHIEAGLRTGEREPFPEEKNRELIGRLAHWHFPPTEQSRDNLLREGIAPQRVHLVGNTVIDTALWVREHMASDGFDATTALPSPLRNFLAAHPTSRMLLVTAHRRENWGQPIRNIAQAVGQLLQQHPDLIVVWPIHPNPTVRHDVESVFSTLDAATRRRTFLTDPLDYPALISVLAQCHFTLTDSGGIQEEASALARPVLIARDSTERQELVQAGGARLVGTDTERIVDAASALLTQDVIYRAMQLTTSPFGDGRSAQRIADILSQPA